MPKRIYDTHDIINRCQCKINLIELPRVLTLFSGFLRIFLVAAGVHATFGTTTFIIFDCCCDNCAAEAIDEFVVLFGGKVSLIQSTGRASSRGPSLQNTQENETKIIIFLIINFFTFYLCY